MFEMTPTWHDGRLTLTLEPDHGIIELRPAPASPNKSVSTLYFQGPTLLSIDQQPDLITPDRVLTIQPEEGIEPRYLSQTIATLAKKASYQVSFTAIKIPANHQRPTLAYLDQLGPITTLLGLSFPAKVIAKKQPAKVQHRWKKTVSTVAFTTNYADTNATIYWRKRNKMVIMAGAKLKAEPTLNADGSLGFSARFAQQLRAEHQTAFNDNFVTTEDIVLKSTNEVGLFLYFAGTNSWLQFKDTNGKTLDEWTAV